MVVVFTQVFSISLVSGVHIREFNCENLWMKSMFTTAALLRRAFEKQVTSEVHQFAAVALDSSQQHRGKQQDQRKAIVCDNFHPHFPPLIQHLLLEFWSPCTLKRNHPHRQQNKPTFHNSNCPMHAFIMLLTLKPIVVGTKGTLGLTKVWLVMAAFSTNSSF